MMIIIMKIQITNHSNFFFKFLLRSIISIANFEPAIFPLPYVAFAGETLLPYSLNQLYSGADIPRIDFHVFFT